MFTPLEDRFIVKLDEKETVSKGGIVIHHELADPPQTAEVIFAPPYQSKYEKMLIDHKPVYIDVKTKINPGDKVLINKFAGVDVKIGEKKYRHIKREEIMGIFHKGIDS